MTPRLLALLVLAALAAPVAPARAAGPPILPLSQVQPGMDCTGLTVVQGTTISSFRVHVINVVNSPGEGPRILVRVSGPAVDKTGVAEGFSGSPVYCAGATPGEANAGAISESLGEAGNKEVLVTPIEQMLAEPILPPLSATRLSRHPRQLLGPVTVSGLSPATAALLQRAASLAGRRVLSVPAGPLSSFPAQPLVPGAAVAASYSEGAIAIGAIGTVTYRDGANVYAFGHPLDGVGRRSLLLQDAYVYDVIDAPVSELGASYKLAAPGHVEGTLASDTPNAVVGRVGSQPDLIPVEVAARDLDTGRELSLVSQAADETDIGSPLGISIIDTIAPLSVNQAATEIFDGAPANESGAMCFEVDLREGAARLRFCNRYVGRGGGGGDSGLASPEVAGAASADATTGLGLLDQVQFARLHVRRVFANIDVSRGLAEGSIVRATAPVAVRRGQRVLVMLTVHRIRGPFQRVPVALVIPRGARRGALRTVLEGPSLSSSPGEQSTTSLLTSLAQSLSGAPSPPSAHPPGSLRSLERQFAAISHYDGLTVRFSGRGMRSSPSRRLYRDPTLLIGGRATLRFVVR